MLPTLLFLVWEIPLVLVAVRIAMLLVARYRAKCSAEEFFLLAVSSSMVLEAVPAAALSFAHANSTAAYLAMAAIYLIFGARRSVVKEISSRLQELALWRLRITAAIICAAAIPLFFLTLKPIEEIDSVNYLHFLLEWRTGRLTPYTFSTYYVAFGPSRFMPALVLTRTDWFFGFVALEPVVLLALGLYLIGDELEIPPRLRLWTVAGAIALQHFWGCHSGVGTLKSDPLHAAGAVLLALVLLRAAHASFSPALFAFAAVFATEKYTGILLCIVATAAVLWLRVPFAKLLPAALLFLVTTGHYYLRSLLRWGNPFYPFTVRIWAFELPGTGDLSSTSIAANWHNPRLWTLFFLPSHGLSPAGLLFPLILATMMTAALWIVVSGFRRRPPVFWLACLLLLGWLLFVRTFWSAGSQPNSLGFLESDLSTLRYVEGFLALGEVFLIWLLWKQGVPQGILLAAIALNGASRLWLLYTQPNLHLFPSALWIGAAVIVGIACLRLSAGAALVVAAALAIAAPAIVERNRQTWFLDWREIYQPIRNLAPTTIFLLDDANSGFNALHFALCGQRLEHDVRTSGELSAMNHARYAVRVLGSGQPESDLAVFTNNLAPQGYHSVLQARYGVILERASLADWNVNDSHAWYLPPGKMAAASLAVDAGDALASMHRLQAGDLVVAPANQILRLADRSTQVLRPPEGIAIHLQNCGSLRGGKPQGLIYHYRDNHWQADRPKAPLPESPIISIEHGSFQLEQLRDDRGPYLRIHAQNDANWLVMVTNLPTLAERTPFTAFSTARCAKGKTCAFWLWTRNEVSDFAGPQTGEWYRFNLLRRAKNPAAGDHLAIGLKDAHAGDYFEVREIAAIEGFFP